MGVRLVEPPTLSHLFTPTLNTCLPLNMQKFLHLITLLKLFLLLGMHFAAWSTPINPLKPSSNVPSFEKLSCLSGSQLPPLVPPVRCTVRLVC